MDKEIKIFDCTEKEIQKYSIKYKALGYEWIDIVDENIRELEEIYKYQDEAIIFNLIKNKTVLVDYPWLRSIVRICPEGYFLELLSSRNRNLISSKEQKTLRKAKISVAGLSVGSNICKIMAMQGVGRDFNIADSDILSSTNLNRVSESILNVGKPKTLLTKRRLLEINPFLNINLFNRGLTIKNITTFIRGASVVFDEIDNLNLKLKLREAAKNERKPLVMITDNGDNVMVDIERYDTDPKLIPFHGLLNKFDLDLIKKAKKGLKPSERVKLSLKIVQPQNAVPKMQKSLVDVGKTLNTWPQLGTAATLAGAVGCMIARKIILKEALVSGRRHISLDAELEPGHRKVRSVLRRHIHTMNFKKSLGRK